ncbi:putative ribosomal elongation factor EF-2 [Meira miltonrushii]|uniref:116 kDa U5 small nuclear ribonucleoprotein component n=1 Tax=Meira miltonrushii TaxID=1280837 RepID=A0A316VJT0_9BASI|nr:putative ribosomal elongation factor EF-2 [Meira miltonrushii]PWN36281.1 putative ribosomal elongation factor EF-2 [Meira miltonrushii]
MDDYDEFGNYIGVLSDSDDDSDIGQDEQEASTSAMGTRQEEYEEPAPLEGYDDESDEDEEANIARMRRVEQAGMQLMQVDESSQNAVVLHEDKKYYPSANEVYGDEVETLVQEEDAQPISQPIVEPVKMRKFAIEEAGLPETRFERSFMMNLMNFPEMVRNVAICGHLHHGKTCLLDMLLLETHKMDHDVDKHMRYTDSHLLERSRGISIKSSPLSLVMTSTKSKSYLLNLIDTPGHPNFQDEVAAGIRMADGVVLVVDVVEGVMVNTEAIVKHAIREGLPIVMVLNKIDRLILELRLPPNDAYYKIRQTIDEVNNLIAQHDRDPARKLGPERGNVAFASTEMGWCFTLRSFAKLYSDTYGGIDIDQFSKRLWGNIFYSAESRNFSRKGADAESKRSFVQFILEPLYKIYTQVLSSDTDKLRKTLASLGIHLKPAAYKIDVRPLLKLVLKHFFGDSAGLVDLMVNHIPSPKEGAQKKIDRIWTGPKEGGLYGSMRNCNADGPLIVSVAKLYQTTDAQEFRAFGRVLSGTVKIGDRVRVLGEGFSQDDDEDSILANVEGVWINESRYNVESDSVPAGCWVSLKGVDANITKTGTIVDASIETDELHIIAPLSHMTQPVLKVSVEPLVPSELPKMLEGLRKINKSYPLAVTKVEESGEHVILGTGELYLDCVLHDLRKLFSEIEIKVSDPVVRFAETVVETSAVKCFAVTPNKKNKLTIIAEPLEKGIAEDIESGRLDIHMPPKELGKLLQEKYGWDLLASRSVWAFGPSDDGPNILVDDTLPSEVDKKLLYTVRQTIKQGFQWATREGPLADEPVRNVKFRILDAQLAPEPINRGSGQLIPTARRTCYAALLLATPRLMEPIYYVEVQAPADCVAAVYTVLARRRGHVTQDVPKPGTPLFIVRAYIPVLDANGFETDLRTHTQGQAFCLQVFSHYSVVPGDPLDTDVKLRPLEPAPPLGLARDVMLKTRRRKGLADQVTLASYLDPELAVALAANGFDLN